jgi:hypothetical protein
MPLRVRCRVLPYRVKVSAVERPKRAP